MRDLILAGGTIAAALGILFVAEILFDLDELDHLRRHPRAHPDVGLGIAGVVLYYAATQWWTGGPAALDGRAWPRTIGRPGSSSSAPGLVLIGWLGNVTIGIWFAAGRRRGHHAHPARGARDARGGRPG